MCRSGGVEISLVKGEVLDSRIACHINVLKTPSQSSCCDYCKAEVPPRGVQIHVVPLHSSMDMDLAPLDIRFSHN